jgi:hypothetical protein
MQIFVKTLTGKTITLVSNLFSTVQQNRTQCFNPYFFCRKQGFSDGLTDVSLTVAGGGVLGHHRQREEQDSGQGG